MAPSRTSTTKVPSGAGVVAISAMSADGSVKRHTSRPSRRHCVRSLRHPHPHAAGHGVVAGALQGQGPAARERGLALWAHARSTPGSRSSRTPTGRRGSACSASPATSSSSRSPAPPTRSPSSARSTTASPSRSSRRSTSTARSAIPFTRSSPPRPTPRAQPATSSGTSRSSSSLPRGRSWARFRPGVEPEDAGLVGAPRRGPSWLAFARTAPSSAWTRRAARWSTSPTRRDVLCRARRRAVLGVRAPCHRRRGAHGDGVGIRVRPRGRAGAVAAPRRPLPAPSRCTGPRRRSRVARPRVAVTGGPGARRTPRLRHVAARGARRHQLRQSRPAGAHSASSRRLGPTGLAGAVGPRRRARPIGVASTV